MGIIHRGEKGGRDGKRHDTEEEKHHHANMFFALNLLPCFHHITPRFLTLCEFRFFSIVCSNNPNIK